MRSTMRQKFFSNIYRKRRIKIIILLYVSLDTRSLFHYCLVEMYNSLTCTWCNCGSWWCCSGFGGGVVGELTTWTVPCCCRYGSRKTSFLQDTKARKRQMSQSDYLLSELLLLSVSCSPSLSFFLVNQFAKLLGNRFGGGIEEVERCTTQLCVTQITTTLIFPREKRLLTSLTIESPW